jgi:type II secretory pathway pseudopilin PulG
MKKMRRGSTLVELCLVIAISAVVFAMIASFAVLIQYRAVAAQEDYEAVNDVNLIRTAIFDWLKEYDSPNSTISTNGGSKLTITHTLPRTTDFIEFKDGWFKSPTVYEKMPQIVSVKFNSRVMGKVADCYLLEVKVTYTTSKGEGTQTLLFATYSQIIGG